MAAAPSAPGKKKAPAPSSTKALVAGDPKRLPRPPAAAAKGSNQKRRRLKAAQTEKTGRNILQSLRYYNSTLKFLFVCYCCHMALDLLNNVNLLCAFGFSMMSLLILKYMFSIY